MMHALTRLVLGTSSVLALVGSLVAACKTNSISATTNIESDAIGPAGGSLTGADGEKLIVPANALTTTTVFDLSVAQPGTDSYPNSPPDGLSFAGNVYEYQPHGTQFATPATVVIPYTSEVTSPVLWQAEEGATSWTPFSTTGTTMVDVGGISENALEGAVSTLSYFVVAGASIVDSGMPTGCSGRSPVSGAPTGSVSNFTGSIVDTRNGRTIELANIVDGYVYQPPGVNDVWALELTQYAGACGYVENDDSKIGAETLAILIEEDEASTLSVQTYGTSQVGAIAYGPNADAGVAACAGDGVNPMAASAGTGVTIDAVDSSHVQGSFSLTPHEGTPISGSFNLPICAIPTNLQACCLE